MDQEAVYAFAKNNISWLGHDGFLIEAEGKTIVIDPFNIKQASAKADIILITHEHYDHCSPEDVAKLIKPATQIITEEESAKKLSGYNVSVLEPWETLAVSGITIETVPSYNTNKKFHPRANGWLGFIVTIDGIRIYHAGDTDLIEEMNGIKADIALLPVSGTYVMTAEEAVDAAKRIAPTAAIPMHYGAIVGETNDATIFAKGLEGVCKVLIKE